MEKYEVGDRVIFVDEYGIEHNALIIYVWQSCLNIAYVDVAGGDRIAAQDSFGNCIIKRTSIPLFQEGMSGLYVK